MNRLFTLITILVLSYNAIGQSREYEKTIKSISEQTQVHTMTITRSTFALLTCFDIELGDEMREIADGLEQVKIVICANDNSSFTSNAKNVFSKSKYTNVDVSEYGNIGKSEVYVDHGLVRITEAHIILDYGQGAVISFFGSFKIRDIKKLIKGANKVGSTTVGN